MRAWLLGTAAALAAMTAAGSSLAADVTVKINGLQARHGVVYAVVQSADQFLKHASTKAEVLPDPAAGSQTVVLHDVPPGDYAVVVIHDENGDKQLNFGPNGIPTEGWGVSGFAPGTQHPPLWDESKVTVPATGAAVEVAMTYPPAN